MLTNPTRYGLIACRYLVWGWHNGVWLNAPEIAERYRMNVRALSPALRRLVLAGILRSQCGGTRPGFMLSRPPEEVTMLEVVRALEGNFRMDCCRTVLSSVGAHARRNAAWSAGYSATCWTNCGGDFRMCRSRSTPQRKNFRVGYKALQTNNIAYYSGIFQR